MTPSKTAIFMLTACIGALTSGSAWSQVSETIDVSASLQASVSPVTITAQDMDFGELTIPNRPSATCVYISAAGTSGALDGSTGSAADPSLGCEVLGVPSTPEPTLSCDSGDVEVTMSVAAANNSSGATLTLSQVSFNGASFADWVSDNVPCGSSPVSLFALGIPSVVVDGTDTPIDGEVIGQVVISASF